MVLVTFLAILNVMNDIMISCDEESGGDCVEGEEVTNHLQVTSALTLTIIFVLPQVVDSNSYRVKFKLMTREAISVMVFFFSLVLASVPRRMSIGRSASTEVLGVILMALSTFFVPLHNFYIYFGLKKNLYQGKAINKNKSISIERCPPKVGGIIWAERLFYIRRVLSKRDYS